MDSKPGNGITAGMMAAVAVLATAMLWQPNAIAAAEPTGGNTVEPNGNAADNARDAEIKRLRTINAEAAVAEAIRNADWASASERIGVLAGMDPENKLLPDLRQQVKTGQERAMMEQVRKETANVLRAEEKQRQISEATKAATAAIARKDWDEAENRVEALRQLDSSNANLVAMLNAIMLGRQAQPTATATTPVPAPQPGAAPAPPANPAVALPLPASGYYDLDQIFAGSEYGNFNRFTRKSILRQAQDKLKTAGLYASGVDGSPGKGTHQGIVAWQTSRSLNPTGRLDDATLASMELKGLKELAPPQEPEPQQHATKVKYYYWPWPPHYRTTPYRGPTWPRPWMPR